MSCKHNDIEWGEDTERGICKDCGATCDWHWEKDEGNVEDYYWSGEERIIDEWYSPYDLGE